MSNYKKRNTKNEKRECCNCKNNIFFTSKQKEEIKSKSNEKLKNKNFENLNEKIITLNNFLKNYLTSTELCFSCQEKLFGELNKIMKYDEKNRIDSVLNFFIDRRFNYVFNLSQYMYIEWVNKDLLLPSLKKYWFGNEIRKNSNDLLNKIFSSDLELLWFYNPVYYASFPNYIKTNYILKNNFGKNTKNQGKYNGPDYILINPKTNRTIGIELTELYKETYSGLDYKGAKKVIKQNIGLNVDEKFKNLLDNITSEGKEVHIWVSNGGRKIEEFLKDVLKTFKTKLEKANKYQYVDELIICIGLDSSVPTEYYDILNYNINNYIKNHKYFFKINAQEISALII